MIRKRSKPSKADKSSTATLGRVGVAFRLPPALVDRLVSAGCHPVRRVKRGTLFHRTSTVLNIIGEYARELQAPPRRQQP